MSRGLAGYSGMPSGDRGVRGRGQKADNVQHRRGSLSRRPDRHGNRMVSDAQHVATERALASLRQRGLSLDTRHQFIPTGQRFWCEQMGRPG